MIAFLVRFWDLVTDWMDEATGLKIGKVEVTRWNLIAAVLAFIGCALYGWYVESWRTFALLFGGYVLGGLWTFMRREQRGE